jgi:hypothetical protein
MRRTTRRRVIPLITAMAAALVLASGTALAVSQLDQQNADTSAASTRESAWIQSDSSGAQKFTAGRTGKLDKVSVYLSRENATGDLTVGIQGLDSSGNPDGTFLASETKPVGEVPAGPSWVDVDLSPAAAVTAGTQYALVLAHSGSGHYSWKLTPADLYSGGYLMFTAFNQWHPFETRDFLFKTFVDDDTQAPTVTATTPTTEKGVSRTNPNITATFSELVKKDTVEEINPTTLKTVNVKLISTATGKQVGATVNCDADPCQTVTVTPKKSLASLTKYKVTVSSKVEDLAGNHLDQDPTKDSAQPKTWTFTTGK